MSGLQASISGMTQTVKLEYYKKPELNNNNNKQSQKQAEGQEDVPGKSNEKALR
jgi:hypothetical protein